MCKPFTIILSRLMQSFVFNYSSDIQFYYCPFSFPVSTSSSVLLLILAVSVEKAQECRNVNRSHLVSISTFLLTPQMLPLVIRQWISKQL